MTSGSLCAVAMILLASLAGAEATLTEEGGKLTFTGERLALQFDRATGAWTGLSEAPGTGARGEPRAQDLIAHGSPQAPVDFDADGRPVCSDGAGLRLVSHQVAGNTLSLTCRAGDWQVVTTYELLPEAAVVRRGLKIRYEGKGQPRLGSTRFIVPGVRIGEAKDCEIRGPQFNEAVVPFTAMKEGQWRQAEMAGEGAWSAVYNPRLKRAVICSFIARTEGYGGWSQAGKDAASLGSTLWTTDLVKPGQEYELGAQYVSVRRGEWLDCLPAVRDMYRLHGFVARPQAPEWVKRAILYTMYPGGTMESGLRDTGGFQNVTRYTLPRIQRLGCNTLWFLPICPGLYGPTDYYAIEPAIGTEADLHTCVQAARQDGIRVLLDLVPHGPATSSPLKTQHPDWFCKDEKGQLALWWGCLYGDYANPGWQKYMADLARSFVEKHGISGWRVDCAAGGPPNWDPARKVRASQSGLWGGLEVLKAAKASMRQVDQETVLLPEALGPMMLENSDLVYDYPLYFSVLKRFVEDESPEAWCKKLSWWLEQQRLTWPEGACFGLMRFLENHDNVRYWRYAGLGPSRALMAICAWIQGVPLYHHLQEVGSSFEFERINALRQKVPELNTGTARYLAAPADTPGVFTCLREDGDNKALVVVNLTGRTADTTISLPADALPKADRIVAYACRSAQPAYMNGYGAEGCPRALLPPIRLGLGPYEAALVLLRPAGRFRPSELPAEPHYPFSAPRPRVEKTDTGARMVAPGLCLEVSAKNGGLPTALTTAGDNVLSSMNLREGRVKPFGPGKALNLSAGEATVTVDQDRGMIHVEGTAVRGNLGGKEMKLAYRLNYQCMNPAQVQISLGLKLPVALKRTTGTLALEMAFQNTERWAVQTVEGTLEDRVERFHPVPGDYSGSWLQHVTGDRLWESATLPSESPVISLASSDKWCLCIANIAAPADLPVDNIYLRETRGEDRKELGPTLVIAWMDNRGPRNLEAGRWYELSFILWTGPVAGPYTGGLVPGQVYAEGANYVAENSQYRLVIGKSGGGIIRSFTDRATGWRAIVDSGTYTDAGFYEKASNEGGTYGTTADWADLEPEVRWWREGDRLILELEGLMHGSNWNWAFAASPPMHYRKRFVFDWGGTVHCEVAVKPSVAKTQMKGFLAHRLLLGGVGEWEATGEKGPLTGKVTGTEGRTWQSRAAPLRANAPAIALSRPDGKESLIVSGITMSPRAQDIFFHQATDALHLYLAWYDFDPADAAPDWHTLSYDLHFAPGKGLAGEVAK